MLPTNIWTAEYKPHTKTALIYALGGGNGHLQRASLLSECFANATIMHHVRPSFSCSARVVYPQGGDLLSWSAQFVQENAASFDCIVMDTFPQGIGHEIKQHMMKRYPQHFLVARFLREEAYAQYRVSCSWFTNILLPYSIHNSEWEHPPKGVYIGTITRPLSISKETPVELCVIGEQGRIPKRWRSLFPVSTQYIHHRFDELPSAHRYLCVGAGYNLFWELYSMGRVAGHIALEKRYDDQFYRAGRLGRLITSHQDCAYFLGCAP